MTIVDIIILVILVISSLIGVFRGLIKEALSLVSWVAAIFVASMYSEMLADLMVDLLDNSTVRRVAAFAIIFLVITVVGTLISNFISKLSSSIGLGGVDKALGIVFGLLRGGIIVLVLIYISRPIEFTQVWYEGSILTPNAERAIDYLQASF